MTARDEVVLFAPVGPNPAPVSELVWALYRQRGLVVTDAFFVVDREARKFLVAELLAPGAALDELHAVLGRHVLPHARVRVHEVRVGGRLIVDDRDPAHAEAYNAAVWSAARAAVEAAGTRPVVFGMVAGRRRTMTALATVSAELLARDTDLCLDVRVSDVRAEGGSGFFFPEQPADVILTRGGILRASEVAVHLVDVALPRLRALLREEDLATYADALAAGQRAIDSARPPRLEVDLEAGAAGVDGTPLELSEAELMWVAALVAARLGGGDGWLASGAEGALERIARACRGRPWAAKVRSKALRAMMGSTEYDRADAGADLAKLRADAKRRIVAWCKHHRPAASSWLIPQSKKAWHDGALAHFQRIALPPARLALVGLENPQ